MNKLLTAQAAAELLGLAKQTVYQLVCAKKIPYVKLGRALRFKPEDLSEWVRKKSSITIEEEIRNNHVSINHVPFDSKYGRRDND